MHKGRYRELQRVVLKGIAQQRVMQITSFGHLIQPVKGSFGFGRSLRKARIQSKADVDPFEPKGCPSLGHAACSLEHATTHCLTAGGTATPNETAAPFLHAVIALLVSAMTSQAETASANFAAAVQVTAQELSADLRQLMCHSCVTVNHLCSR